MQANLMKMGFGLLYSLATAVVFLVLFSGSPAVAAGEGEAFIFLPGDTEASRAERQISPNCWRQLSKLGAWSASFAKLSRLRAALLRTCTEWKLNSVTL